MAGGHSFLRTARLPITAYLLFIFALVAFIARETGKRGGIRGYGKWYVKKKSCPSTYVIIVLASLTYRVFKNQPVMHFRIVRSKYKIKSINKHLSKNALLTTKQKIIN